MSDPKLGTPGYDPNSEDQHQEVTSSPEQEKSLGSRYVERFFHPHAELSVEMPSMARDSLELWNPDKAEKHARDAERIWAAMCNGAGGLYYPRDIWDDMHRDLPELVQNGSVEEVSHLLQHYVFNILGFEDAGGRSIMFNLLLRGQTEPGKISKIAETFINDISSPDAILEILNHPDADRTRLSTISDEQYKSAAEQLYQLAEKMISDIEQSADRSQNTDPNSYLGDAHTLCKELEASTGENYLRFYSIFLGYLFGTRNEEWGHKLKFEDHFHRVVDSLGTSDTLRLMMLMLKRQDFFAQGEYTMGLASPENVVSQMADYYQEALRQAEQVETEDE